MPKQTQHYKRFKRLMKASILDSLTAELYDDDFQHWETLREMEGGKTSEWKTARLAIARRLETIRSKY